MTDGLCVIVQVFPAAPRQPGPALHHLLLSQPAHHHYPPLPHIRQQGGRGLYYSIMYTVQYSLPNFALKF